MPNRTLSDSDVAALGATIMGALDYDMLAEKVEQRMVERFQLETGKAVWGTAKRWLIKVLIWAAVLLMAIQAGMLRPFADAFMKGNP